MLIWSPSARFEPSFGDHFLQQISVRNSSTDGSKMDDIDRLWGPRLINTVIFHQLASKIYKGYISKNWFIMVFPLQIEFLFRCFFRIFSADPISVGVWHIPMGSELKDSQGFPLAESLVVDGDQITAVTPVGKPRLPFAKLLLPDDFCRNENCRVFSTNHP